MQVETYFSNDSSTLVVMGGITPNEVGSILELGRNLLRRNLGQLVVDLRNATVGGSMFIGSLARLALDARNASQKLLIRATDHIADWLVWAGLHRIANLDVTTGPARALV